MSNEEVVCNAMESMLTDNHNTVVNHLAELNKENPELYKKMKGEVDRIGDAVSKKYKEHIENGELTMPGKYISDLKDELDELRKMFAEALQKAGENYKAAGGKAIGETKFSIREYGFEELNKDSINNIRLRQGIILNTVDELKYHIGVALSSKEQKNMYLGAISNSVRNRIEDDLGERVFFGGQYSFAISYDDIRHISKHFGTIEEIADEVKRLYDIFQHYDSVSLVTKNNGERRLVFNKAYSDADYRTVEVASKGRRAVDLVTFFITKNNIKKGVQPNPPAAPVSGSFQRGSSPKNSIAPKNNNVKTKGKFQDREPIEETKNLVAVHNTNATKNVCKIIEAKEEEEYSSRGSYGMSNRGSYGDGSYTDGSFESSFARGRGRNARRDSMGRYSRDDKVIHEMRSMMNSLPANKRQDMERIITKMEQM